MSDDAAIAWCAGLYEGEGTVIYGENHTGPLTVKLSSTDKDVLDLLVERSGVGAVYGPNPPRGLGKKPFWTWSVRGEAAVEFLITIGPWLGKRRRRRSEEKILLWMRRPQREIKVTPEMKDQIFKDRANGDTYQVIADRNDISLARVFQIVKQMTTEGYWVVNDKVVQR